MAAATIDALVIKEIGEDPNFQKLVLDKTLAEPFGRQLREQVVGYSQKKRFQQGLQAFTKKVEEAEQRLIVAGSVGKFKAPNPDDKLLTDLHTSFELKEKKTVVDAQLQSMIDEGQITHEEKPAVLDNLRTRLAKAKEAGKSAVEEKLDKMMSTVCKSTSFVLPVVNLEEFHQLNKEIQAIEKLEKLNARNLTSALRDRIENKAAVQGDFDALVESSQMWFETATEFKPRLGAAMREWAATEEERKKKEEEEAFEKKVAAENEALEKKRAEAARKQAVLDKALEDKLKEKRLEAAGKPVKEIQKAKPKEKKVISTVDLKEMFHEEPDYQEISAAQIQADLEAEEKKNEWAKAYAEMHRAMKEAAPAKLKEAVTVTKAAVTKAVQEKHAAEKKAAASKPAEKASMWSEPEKTVLTAEEKEAIKEEKAKALEEKLAQKRLDAAAKPQKEVAAPPKKKEVKKATKMSLLDFYDENDLLNNLAKQEAIEKADKAVADAEAAKLAEENGEGEEDEEQWTAEEMKLWEKGITTTGITTVTTMKPSLFATDAGKSAPETSPSVSAKEVADAKPAPKPKRRPPVEIESKWGASAAAPVSMMETEDGELELVGPSLAEAMSGPAPKKTAPPAPKKKGPKKWGKVDAGLIGFVDPNQFA